MLLIQKSRREWHCYENPVSILETEHLEQVQPLLKKLEDRVEMEGLYGAGYLRYEAAPAFDKALKTHPAQEGKPLLYFALFKQFRCGLLEDFLKSQGKISGHWSPQVKHREYENSIKRIKNYLKEGETYQVNYTLPLKGPTIHRDQQKEFLKNGINGQLCSYGAWINHGETSILSFSPELFFSLDGEKLSSRPMKGTAPRGRWLEQDRENRELLFHSEKNRAENLMIVDMIRNDLGKIAQRGSVQVEQLFSMESYPTVHQMTSQVSCKTESSLTGIFQALFPCASITGAPKVRTMEIIKELEPRPRGIYTGTIGYYHPGRKARFNVAIRTLEVSSQDSTYSVGGGIIWDSDKKEEYSEALLKSRIVNNPLPHFDLLETLGWFPEKGFINLEDHLKRMEWSARFFGFLWNRKILDQELLQSVKACTNSKRVRITLNRQGFYSIETRDFTVYEKPLCTFKISPNPIDSSNPLLYHKTTAREVYNERTLKEVDYSLLQNERGELTEFTIGNLVIEKNGVKFTPPLSSGLLPGIFRKRLLNNGDIKERLITSEELNQADKIWLINSLRGWKELKKLNL